MHIKIFTFFLFVASSLTALAQVEVAFPPTRMVFQRNTSGNAVVFINGTYLTSIDKVQARLKTRPGETGSQVDWTDIATGVTGKVYSGSLVATGGRYDLEVRGMKNGQQVGPSTNIEKVGVGEVFLIVGHSNAAAAGEPQDMLGANSDFVNSVNTNADPNLYQQYLVNGTADYLAPLKPTKICNLCGIAPMAQYPWLWSRLGDLLVADGGFNVPILFYSAAFGGSNIDQTYMSAYNIPFDHGFVNYSIRMPYANIRNAMNAYVPQTGIRAVLSMHGVNDQNLTTDEFKFRSEQVILKSREESSYPNLAWMIATSCYNNGVNPVITAAQEQLINTVPNVFRGANLNLIGNIGRYDGLHFNGTGQQMAAELWRDAITSPITNIKQNAQSLMAKAPPLPGPPLPVTLVSFIGKKGMNGRNNLEWVTSAEENNDYFEVQKSADAIHFEPFATIKGVGTSKETNTYSLSDEAPFKDLTYYRLKQVDYDGTSALSRIVGVRHEIMDPAIEEFVYPNPAEHYIEISTNNGASVEEVTLFDLKGATLMHQTKSGSLDVSKLTKGDYFIQFKLSSGESIRKKIAKM